MSEAPKYEIFSCSYKKGVNKVETFTSGNIIYAIQSDPLVSA